MLEMEKDFDCLADPSMQSLFYLLFFRSPVENHQCHLGAGELIVSDRALYENCLKFIQKGLSHFDRMDEGSSGARFFFEFAFYLGKYLTDAGSDELRARAKKLCNLNTLNEWITKEKVPETTVSAMHLYRLLYYSLENIETLEAEELGNIYESWIKSRLYIQDSDWVSPIPERFALDYILRLTYRVAPKLSKRGDDFRDQVFGKMAQGLGLIVNKEQWDWDVSGWGYPTFGGRNRDSGDKITIELSKGKVHTKWGALKEMPLYTDWIQRIDFQRIFHGNNKFSYQSIGEMVTFTLPTFGNFRLFSKNRLDYLIESQFPESEQWYQYSMESMASLPSIMKHDHTFWIPVNGPKLLDSGIFITGYIARLKDHRRVMATTNKGHIIQVNPDTGVPLPNTRYLYHVEPKNKSAVKGITDFENGDNILLHCDEAHRIEEIHFPRYTSIEGNPLVFLRDGTNYIWTENRQYVLPAKKAFVDLGSIQEYLFLSSKNSKDCDKIFLPSCRISEGKLDIQSKKPPINPKKKEGLKEQWGLYQYFVYNVLQGEVVPTSLEGQLFLAYIHLSQKKYSDAIHLIKQIKPIDTLSEISLEILEFLLRFPSAEHHPEEKMVYIFAAIAKLRHIEKPA